MTADGDDPHGIGRQGAPGGESVSRSESGSGSGRVRRRVLVTGRVQAVGFRYGALNEATSLGVTGWVRNLDTGTDVETEVEGRPEPVAEMIEWLKVGPRFARVQSIRVTEIPTEADSSFKVIGY